MDRLMFAILSALALLASSAMAAEPPLRFSVSDSWTMPLARIENGVATGGILIDMMTSLAKQLDAPAEFHVIARLRLQNAMERGDIDVRCYTAQSWLPNMSGDYIWSLPLVMQRDILIATADDNAPVDPATFTGETVGTVLGYTYPTLQTRFANGLLLRDNGRTQDLVMYKLAAGRYRYAVSNQLSLDWFNAHVPPAQRLRSVGVVREQELGCYVRNDPNLPVQRILRTLLRMKMSGEIDRLIEHYQQTAYSDPVSQAKD